MPRQFDPIALLVPGAILVGLAVIVLGTYRAASERTSRPLPSLERQAAAVCREFLPRAALPDRPADWIDYLDWTIDRQADGGFRVVARYSAHGPWSGTRDRMTECFVRQRDNGDWQFVKIRRIF